MSQQCHVCGPVKHEAPTVICSPCALQDERSKLARQRLEALVPLADTLRCFDREMEIVFRPFMYAEFRFK